MVYYCHSSKLHLHIPVVTSKTPQGGNHQIIKIKYALKNIWGLYLGMGKDVPFNYFFKLNHLRVLKFRALETALMFHFT